MIYLAEVLSALQDLKSSVPVYLIGGIVDRGFSENDVDIFQSSFAYRQPFNIRKVHIVHPEEIDRTPASPLLPIGAPILWDYADKMHYETDEFAACSTAYWGGKIKHLLPGKKVLDIGCSDGFALAGFKHAGAHPIGISSCPEDIRICREKGYEAYLMDQNLLEFDDETFDIIWSHHTLEHSIAPVLAVREAFRVLKSEGLFDLTVGIDRAPGHQYRFDIQTLASMLIDAGFVFDRSNVQVSRPGISPEIHISAGKEL